jgi:predicted alpha/beta-fold hydrolase
MKNFAYRIFRNDPPAQAGAGNAAEEFRPLPLLSNPHLQTVIAAYWAGPTFDYPTREQVIRLPDGDSLMLYDSVPAGWQPGDRMAMLIHGLTGSHRSYQVQRTARQFLERGVRVVRIDQRSAGRGIPLARKTYHGGRSDDIRAVTEEMHRWSPTSAITIIGFSLGGNLALKLAGEAVTDPVPGLERVVTVSPPVDLARCCALMSLPRNRQYENHFLRGLLAEARERHHCFPDLPPLRLPRRMTMRVFDDLYTAPTCGFSDALDYYKRASALPLVPRINVPTLILTARDDPFIAVEPIETLPHTDYLTVQVLSHGGHLGFLGWDGQGGVRWADRRIIDWVFRNDLPTKRLDTVSNLIDNGMKRSP